jgi:FKBP-type peptidyl-prolyl cis-trans isomerase FkpA
VGACALADSTQPSIPAEETFAPSLGVNISTMTRYSESLYYQDVVVGTGTPAAAVGKKITVFYTGYLKNGTQFDSNIGSDSLRITLGDSLIVGWQLGIAGMKPGGTRKLVVGSLYAYGAQEQRAPGRVTIPPHSTLVFDIQLKRVE